jgi:hypothetical protein
MMSTASKAKWPKFNGVIDAQQRLNIGTRGHEVLNLRADRRERTRLFPGRHEPNGDLFADL